MAMAVALISAIFWQPFIKKVTIAGWCFGGQGRNALRRNECNFCILPATQNLTADLRGYTRINIITAMRKLRIYPKFSRKLAGETKSDTPDFSEVNPRVSAQIRGKGFELNLTKLPERN
jgi:hypothetical protein